MKTYTLRGKTDEAGVLHLEVQTDQADTDYEVVIVAQEGTRSKHNGDKPSQQRVPGLHAGTTWMSEDFNDPLPDEFWLGEE